MRPEAASLLHRASRDDWGDFRRAARPGRAAGLRHPRHPCVLRGNNRAPGTNCDGRCGRRAGDGCGHDRTRGGWINGGSGVQGPAICERFVRARTKEVTARP